MLGELIGKEKGKVIVRRVLPTTGNPRVEVSFETAGSLVGGPRSNQTAHFMAKVRESPEARTAS